MKRILVLTLVALVLAFATAGLASADGGPHGGYTATTDACAGCHRAHTAQAPKLLTVDEQFLCLSCHGSDGSGADTNVQDGVYADRGGSGEAVGTFNRGLKGGGFDNTLMVSSLISTAVPSAVNTTSHHNYDGSAGTMWGSGPITSTEFAGATINLSCTNCHDPHGNGQYRILRPIPTGSGSITATLVPDEAGIPRQVNYRDETDVCDVQPEVRSTNYTIGQFGGFEGWYWGEGYECAISKEDTRHFMIRDEYQAVSDWCSQCHTRYLGIYDPGKPAQNPSGDAIFKYRHTAGQVRAGGCSDCHNNPGADWSDVSITFNKKYWNHNVECMTCHVAHGTSATMDGFAGASELPYPDGSDASVINPDAGESARSALLRADGRGTCQGCHDKPGETVP